MTFSKSKQTTILCLFFLSVSLSSWVSVFISQMFLIFFFKVRTMGITFRSDFIFFTDVTPIFFGLLKLNVKVFVKHSSVCANSLSMNVFRLTLFYIHTVHLC